MSGTDGGRWNCGKVKLGPSEAELLCRGRKHRRLKIAFNKDTGELTLKGTRDRGTYDREDTIIWRSVISRSYKWVKQGTRI